MGFGGRPETRKRSMEAGAALRQQTQACVGMQRVGALRQAGWHRRFFLSRHRDRFLFWDELYYQVQQLKK